MGSGGSFYELLKLYNVSKMIILVFSQIVPMHIVGQGPAVLAGGAGQVGYICIFHLSHF